MTGAIMRWRKLTVCFLLLLIVLFVVAIIIIPVPDMSLELGLRKHIALLEAKLKLAEMTNLERKNDLQSLFLQFSEVIRLAQASPIKLGKGAPVEAEALVHRLNWSYDLSLPSIHHALPHTVHNPNSLIPSFKLSKNRHQVDLVMGIPTVRREHQSYLDTTLQSIFESMSPEEMNKCLIVVLVAEMDLDYVNEVSNQIQSHFATHIQSGLLEIIAPPAEFYPNMSDLRRTLGDDLDRVYWRSKQNLDYAFLMMYSQLRGLYYVQLEDDILTKPNFVTTMLNYALEQTVLEKSDDVKHVPWFLIDFCQLGFIGKMFKSTNLPVLVQFFLHFYNDKPGDWLLDNAVTTKVCSLDDDAKKCQKNRNTIWHRYKPSLFQHVGTHSSLKGKTQRLKDKQFGKVTLFVPHKNPPASVETNIKHYKQYTITRAYRGETFFWGLVPQTGDFILFKLTPPIPLAAIKLASGNLEHPSDKFSGSTVEVQFENAHTISQENGHLFASSVLLEDNFLVMTKFDSSGVAEIKFNDQLAHEPVRTVRITVHNASENWAILSEIHFQVNPSA